MFTANQIDIDLTRRALNLAADGIGLVSPNPLVGCVITSKDGTVVGEGTYTRQGVIHAEAIALEQAGPLAYGGTAYVSLEPHDHHGKTPPCTEALINAGIARVVCPVEDPNPLVSGRGFETLRNAGIKVEVGLLADEATRLNEKFICWHQKKRPFVHLKLAMSLDGRISLSDSVSTALSGDEARKRVQEFRHEHDAILVGANTAYVDDPSLTDRSGKLRQKPLVRVVLDNSLRIPVSSTLVTTAREIPTIVVTRSGEREKINQLVNAGVNVIETREGGRDLADVLEHLRQLEIQSVLVEGGTEIAGSFCDARLIDKVSFIAAPIIIGGRTAPNAIGGSGAETLADVLKILDMTVSQLGRDVEITGYPSN